MEEFAGSGFALLRAKYHREGRLPPEWLASLGQSRWPLADQFDSLRGSSAFAVIFP